MRVLFTSWAWRSHYFPSVPLGWAFAAAGHEVRMVSQPSLESTIVESGLPAVTVGSDPDLQATLNRGPSTSLEQTLKNLAAMLSSANEPMVDGLVRLARRWRPDLVIWDPLTFAGAVAARCIGVPDARILWGPDILVHGRQQPTQTDMFDPLGWVSSVFDRFGLPMDEKDLLGRWTIDQCPPSLRLPARVDRLPMRYVPYNGPAVLPDWLLEPPKRPRICLTLGTSTVKLLGRDTVPLAEVLHGLGKLDAEIVLAVTKDHRDLIGDVPPGIRVAESLALHLLVPSCAAVVHQGGVGTTMTVAAAGVPQLIIPNIADQVVNATQIANAGAGLSIGSSADAASFRDGVACLLDDPAYRSSAERIQQEIRRQPTPADVVLALQEAVTATT
jgi:UDP:flavonoid glycosyltransferase YjiC (YdhE family)